LTFSNSEFFNVNECEEKISPKVSPPLFLERRRDFTLGNVFGYAQNLFPIMPANAKRGSPFLAISLVIEVEK